MGTQLKALFTPDWLTGKTTATLLATVKDYMDDVQAAVEASFVKRVAEAAVEELVRRYVNIMLAGLPQVWGWGKYGGGAGIGAATGMGVGQVWGRGKCGGGEASLPNGASVGLQHSPNVSSCIITALHYCSPPHHTHTI